jgi:hypothetical protein
MKVISYFTNKFIGKNYLTSNPQEDNGFDYENHDDYKEIGDVNQSDAGLVKIDELITILQELKDKGANYVACDWHCDHQELDVYGFNYRKSTDEEVQAIENADKAKKELLKQRQIKEMEEKLAKLKAE